MFVCECSYGVLTHLCMHAYYMYTCILRQHTNIKAMHVLIWAKTITIQLGDDHMMNIHSTLEMYTRVVYNFRLKYDL